MVGRMQAPVLALFVACAVLSASPLAGAAPIRAVAQTDAASLPPSAPILEHAAADDDAARERRGSEPRLVFFGGNPRHKLQKCQGDCDRDSDCAGSLKCFQRSGHKKVPGCATGGSGDKKSHDYCYEPAEPRLVFFGGNPRRKLQKCQGDCDRDSDCAGSLKCFQRRGHKKVPGCATGGSGDRKNHDYCYAPPNVCTTGSEGTAGMLAQLKPAATNFQKCHDSVEGIAGNLADLKEGMKDATKAADKMQMATKDIKAVLAKVNDKGIADVLGKIPKFGVFIKMGLKAAGKVATPVDELATMMARAVKKIELAVNITEKTFSRTKRITAPVAKLLTGGHAALDAAHTCAAAAGYKCGSAEGKMELANQKALAHGRDDLAAISKTGEVCSKVLNPVDTAIAAIAAMARQIKEHLLGPIEAVLAAIEDFVSKMDDFINDFLKAMDNTMGDAVECGLDFIKPGSDFANLFTCPVDEAVDAVFRATIGKMVDEVSNLVNEATTKLITKGVEALVPDDLRIEIPDFRPNLPTGAWLATCATAAAFPEHTAIQATFTVVEALYRMKLPYTVTGEQIEQQLLDEVLARTQIEPLHKNGYTSACIEAFNELGTDADFKACSKLGIDVEEVSGWLQTGAQTIDDVKNGRWPDWP